MSAPHYQIIRRPIITEKGLGVKETQHTVVFEVAVGATKTQIKEAVQQIFKVKVDDGRTAIFHGKFRRRGGSGGHRRGVEEGAYTCCQKAKKEGKTGTLSRGVVTAARME